MQIRVRCIITGKIDLQCVCDRGSIGRFLGMVPSNLIPVIEYTHLQTTYTTHTQLTNAFFLINYLENVHILNNSLMDTSATL